MTKHDKIWTALAVNLRQERILNSVQHSSPALVIKLSYLRTNHLVELSNNVRYGNTGRRTYQRLEMWRMWHNRTQCTHCRSNENMVELPSPVLLSSRSVSVTKSPEEEPVRNHHWRVVRRSPSFSFPRRLKRKEFPKRSMSTLWCLPSSSSQVVLLICWTICQIE